MYKFCFQTCRHTDAISSLRRTGDDWSVDVAALVLAPTGDSFWLRAAGRAVQEQDA